MSKQTIWIIVIGVVLLITIVLLTSRKTQAAPPIREEEGGGGMWGELISGAFEGISDLIGESGTGAGGTCRKICSPLKGRKKRQCKRKCKSDFTRGIDVTKKKYF